MTGSGEVKVLGVWADVHTIRVKIALNLKGVKYEFLAEPSWGKSELLLKSNPVYQIMPVLIHDGKPVCQSMIIVDYVNDAWVNGPDFFPSDPYERATARFWAYYIDDKVIPAIKAIRFAETEAAKAEGLSQSLTGLQFLEEAFEKCSKGKGFFGGDTIGFIDIAFGSYLGWLKTAEKFSDVTLLDNAKTPLLKAWADRFLAHDAIKEPIPPIEQFLELAKIIQDRVKAGLSAPPKKI